MKPSTSILLAGTAAASPLAARATFCGQWDLEVAGEYTVYNNLWGMDSADSGSQCTTNNGLTDGNLAWSVEWTWQGGPYNVKSYPNAVVEIEQGALSSVTSIPTHWDWTYAGSSDMVVNVAYDLFTGSSADGAAEFEIMIWLGAFGGAGPISSDGNTIATPTVAGQSWNLYQGVNGQMTVYSFVAPSNVGSFSGDLTEFTTYLIDSQGMSGSQILQSVGAGTEPFLGTDAVFVTSSYSASVSY